MTEVENQTAFAETQPFLEREEKPPVAEEQLPPKNNKKIILIVAGGFVVFFLLLIVAIAGLRQIPQISGPSPEASPTPPTQKELTELQRAVLDAKAAVDQADPVINEYPFPPIDFQIFIQGAPQ